MRQGFQKIAGEDGAFMFLDATSVCYEGSPLDAIFDEYFIAQNGLEAYFK